MHLLLQFLLLAAGFVLLSKGADFFVGGASNLAKRFGIPELIVGLTIVAMGTSAPEAAVSIAGAAKGNADISIGNVVGSNIMNVLVILGLASLLIVIQVARSAERVDIPFMIAITVLFVVLGLDGTIGRVDGIIFLAVFVGYLLFLIKKAKETPYEGLPGKRIAPLWQALLMLVIGLTMIILGSNLAVDAASEIAAFFGMSQRFIGLTIVALGTSLPELFTSVAAARHGNADIAIGNIVGSNIFNILFVLGISSVIVPIHFAPAFRIDGIIAIAVAVLLWIFCINDHRLRRWEGACLLGGYAAYFAYII